VVVQVLKIANALVVTVSKALQTVVDSKSALEAVKIVVVRSNVVMMNAAKESAKWIAVKRKMEPVTLVAVKENFLIHLMMSWNSFKMNKLCNWL
jgi:hypothetical protein